MTAFRRPGLRFVVEAIVIVLTAVVTGVLHLGAVGIAGAVAVVWVLVAVLEYSLSHPREPTESAPLVETLPEPEPQVSDAVRVLPRTPDAVAVEPEPGPELEPEPETQPEPEPVPVEPVPVEPVPVEPEPFAPEPVAVEPEPDPGPEPGTATRWNVWEIERALRGSGTVTEEQEFLLIYLRDYAGPDGSLPLDFDALVRESFGAALGTPAG